MSSNQRNHFRLTATATLGTMAFLVLAVFVLFSPGSLALAGTQTLRHDTVADFNTGVFAHTGLTEDTRPNNAGDGDGEIRLLNVGINPDTWKSDGNTSGLPTTGLWGHAGVYVNGRIYVSGGNDGTNSHGTKGVYFTSIKSNHNLKDWTTTTALPASRYAHIMTELNGYLYVLGGLSSTLDAVKTVYKSQINSDGTIGTWSLTNPLPVSVSDVGIYNSTVVVVGGRIYSLGGSNNTGASLNSVFIGTQGLNGDITWTSATATLPLPLGAHAVALSKGIIYVIGGINNNPNPAFYSPHVYLGTPDQSGDIASFTQSPAVMPNNLVLAGGAAFADQLYAPGGAINTGGSPRKSILSDLVNENGTLIVGGWTTSDVLSDPRIQTVSLMSDDGWLYIIEGGTGSNGLTPLKTIDYGPTATTGGVFAPSGTFVSHPFDLASSRPLLKMRWNTSVFAKTTLTMEYRSANTLTALANASWSPGSPLTSPVGTNQTSVANLSGTARYFQYRATLGNTDVTVTPILNWVELDYDALPTPTPTRTQTSLGGTNTPTSTPTKTTAAPTATRTTTPTVSATACATKPDRVTLLSPVNGKKVNKHRVRLTWDASTCAQKYKVVVKKDAKDGKVVFKKKTTNTHVRTTRLQGGHLYFWKVKACNSIGCAKWSAWWKFKVKQ